MAKHSVERSHLSDDDTTWHYSKMNLSLGQVYRRAVRQGCPALRIGKTVTVIKGKYRFVFARFDRRLYYTIEAAKKPRASHGVPIGRPR